MKDRLEIFTPVERGGAESFYRLELDRVSTLDEARIRFGDDYFSAKEHHVETLVEPARIELVEAVEGVGRILGVMSVKRKSTLKGIEINGTYKDGILKHREIFKYETRSVSE